MRLFSDHQNDCSVHKTARGYVDLLFEVITSYLKLSLSILYFSTPPYSYSTFLHRSTRDGPDQASPQIGLFSGTSVQDGVSTTANQILIKFHSDFSTSGFFVLHYYGKLGQLYKNTLLRRSPPSQLY